MSDAAEMLWVVLASVSGGDWTKQTPDWQEAAARWRDNYFEALKSGLAEVSSPARRQLNWQPIATAPKDGSRFLGGWTHRTYGWLWAGCRWYDDKGAKPVEGGYFVAEGGGEPTHWLRLPALAEGAVSAAPPALEQNKSEKI